MFASKANDFIVLLCRQLQKLFRNTENNFIRKHILTHDCVILSTCAIILCGQLYGLSPLLLRHGDVGGHDDGGDLGDLSH